MAKAQTAPLCKGCRVKTRGNTPKYGTIVGTDPGKDKRKHCWLVLFDGDSKPEAKTSRQIASVSFSDSSEATVAAPKMPSLISSVTKVAAINDVSKARAIFPY